MNDSTHDTFSLDELLHPANAFEHPAEIVNDPDLTLNEKRAILDALRTLDRQANGDKYRRVLRRRRVVERSSRDGESNTGTPLH